MNEPAHPFHQTNSQEILDDLQAWLALTRLPDSEAAAEWELDVPLKIADQLLDNIMLYWLSNSGGSSTRLYWEGLRSFSADSGNVPIGISIFTHEIFQ